MDKLTFIYWLLIGLLVSAALFFGLNVEQQRRSVQGGKGTIENGDLVRLVKVIDGDVVQVTRDGGEAVTVRLLGIKSFDAKVEKDAVTPFAKAAVESLQRIMSGRPVRVLLNVTPKDRHGRYLATLYADDQDIALHLIRQGLVLVYTVYPFQSQPLYLQEQELAHAGKRGLWASAEASDRAQVMISEWRGATP